MSLCSLDYNPAFFNQNLASFSLSSSSAEAPQGQWMEWDGRAGDLLSANNSLMQLG